MSLASHLIGFGLRQFIGDGAEKIVEVVSARFTDHSQVLPQALARANDRAWQAVAIALDGDGWLSSIKVFVCADADEKGIREQVRAFLDSKPFPFEGTAAEFRYACLADLKKARKAGVLDAERQDGNEVARRTADFRRYTDRQGLMDGARQAVDAVAEGLGDHYPSLAQLLRQPTPNGPPLLAAAFTHFFLREVETNAALSRGLTFDSLQRLAAVQAAAFDQIGKAIVALGPRFHEVLHGLGRIEGAVLDVQAELQRLVGLHLNSEKDVRGMLQEVLARQDRAGMRPGEVRAGDSFSIHSEDERRAIKQLLARFRLLPAEERQRVPALLNGLGKLQVGAGEFAEARQTFTEGAGNARAGAGRAEAAYNAFRAALEERKWTEALAAVQQAAELDRDRFAPFPVQRYEARRILGAGAFGTAFLCHDRFLKADVVVKTLHAADLDRRLEDVFGEAQALRVLRHAAIIEVLDCSYADVGQSRPYIVMDYFPGISLQAYVHDHGVLELPDLLAVAHQIAAAMRAAHARGIYHRDLKPDNVLVLKEGGRWLVKVIDFGLALRRQTIETSAARAEAEDTILGNSVAGTVRYAPPEQMGRLLDAKGARVPVGPYSDVYAFGKLCCYALFKTTEPKGRHWATSPLHGRVKDVLERCTEEELEHRHPGFDPVIEALNALTAKQLSPPPSPPAPPRPERQREGEALLLLRYREIMERTRAKPTSEDRAGLSKLCRDYGVQTDRANTLLREEQARWKGLEQLPKERQPGEVVSNSLGMKFGWCPPGTFLMGSPKSEAERSDGETQHRVTLTQGFHLSVYPVTQAQWQAVMGNNPSNFKGEDCPVENVSWDDCQAFCAKLSKRDGKQYRLPTEAQWEYACRAGTTTPFHFGETISTDQANYDGNYVYGKGKKGVYRQQTTAVGSFPPNAWGLYDMHGNVWEWCQDWYGAYPSGNIKDQVSPSSGEHRVLRGGSWCSIPVRCRAATRNRGAPAFRGDGFGCRVSLCLD